MKKINQLQFKHKFNLEVFPTETLLGVRIINCEVLCEDKQYRGLGGIEIGCIFFTISFVKLLAQTFMSSQNLLHYIYQVAAQLFSGCAAFLTLRNQYYERHL